LPLDVELSQQDVEATWAGLRPLIHEDGKSPGELSRKDEIFESPSRLISIAGGKLTGYRKMAERVVDLVVEQGGFSSGPCLTEHTRLEESFESFEAYLIFRNQLKAQFSDSDLQQKAGQLCDIYGRAAAEIVSLAIASGGGSVKEEHLLRAELHHCINKECCLQLSDFVVRRSGMEYFRVEELRRNLDKMKGWMGEDG